MPTKSSRLDKPGWCIIERFMPSAAPEEQDAAYENLESLAALLVRIDHRLFEEAEETRKMLQPPPFK